MATWIGGIAFVAAALYMIKHSIDIGLMSPLVRTVFVAFFGATLLKGAFIYGRKNRQSGSTRIAQALAGSGVIALCFALYSAVELYEIVSLTIILVGMLCVTIFATILSLTFGSLLAVMAQAGGLLTPLLLGGSGAGRLVSLSVYLGMIHLAAYRLASKRWWPILGLCAPPAFIFGLAVLSNCHATVRAQAERPSVSRFGDGSSSSDGS